MSSAAPTMADRDGKIWFDGQMVDWRDAKIHVLTHTLHYGCGAFEGVRAYNTVNGTAIFRLQEHTDRLFNSAKILRMKIPFTVEQVMDAQREVLRANGLKSGYIRPLTWIGSEKLGVSPKGCKVHLMVAAWAWGAYLGEEGMARGIRVKTSSYTRHHVNITMTQAKAVSNYTNSILANMEATDDGYDEAMLLDAAGFVSEGAGENLFVIKKGVVYTPDLSAGALNGITRDTIFAICQDLGLRLVEKRITRDEVYICNIVKCRPPQNRNPLPPEVAACRPFLDGQIQAVAPRVIVTLGKPAASLLLGRDIAITRVRGTWQDYQGIPLMPTLHPAYVLRQYTQENRRAVWEDLRAAHERSRG